MHPEKVTCQILLQVRSIDEGKLQFCTLLLPVASLLANFLKKHHNRCTLYTVYSVHAGCNTIRGIIEKITRNHTRAAKFQTRHQRKAQKSSVLYKRIAKYDIQHYRKSRVSNVTHGLLNLIRDRKRWATMFSITWQRPQIKSDTETSSFVRQSICMQLISFWTYLSMRSCCSILHISETMKSLWEQLQSCW